LSGDRAFGIDLKPPVDPVLGIPHHDLGVFAPLVSPSDHAAELK